MKHFRSSKKMALEHEIYLCMRDQNMIRLGVVSILYLVAVPVIYSFLAKNDGIEFSPAFVISMTLFACFSAASAYMCFSLKHHNKVMYYNKIMIFITACDIVWLSFLAKEIYIKTNTLMFYFSMVLCQAFTLRVRLSRYVLIALSEIVTLVYIVEPGSENFKINALEVLGVVAVHLVAGIMQNELYRSQYKMLENSFELDHESRISIVDPLTGLSNRRGLEKVFDQILRAAKEYSVPLGFIIIDIDHFKKYNDAFGHPEGDQCLKKVSGVLAEVCNGKFIYPARIGGEEFVVFFFNYAPEAVAQYAERIRGAVEAMNLKHAPDAAYDHVTISVGATVEIAGPKLTYDKLYQSADEQLYYAKEHGRNRVCCKGLKTPRKTSGAKHKD